MLRNAPGSPWYCSRVDLAAVPRCSARRPAPSWPVARNPGEMLPVLRCRGVRRLTLPRAPRSARGADAVLPGTALRAHGLQRGPSVLHDDRLDVAGWSLSLALQAVDFNWIRTVCSWTAPPRARFSVIVIPPPCSVVGLLRHVEQGNALQFGHLQRAGTVSFCTNPLNTHPLVAGRGGLTHGGHRWPGWQKNPAKNGDPLPAASLRRRLHPGEGASDRVPLNIRNLNPGTGRRVTSAAWPRGECKWN